MTWSYRRPEPMSRRALRRAVTWSAVILFAVFGLARVVHGGSAPGFHTVRVGSGETLWSIAADHYPTADTRAKVQEIITANHLRQPLVYPGQPLEIPNE